MSSSGRGAPVCQWAPMRLSAAGCQHLWALMQGGMKHERGGRGSTEQNSARWKRAQQPDAGKHTRLLGALHAARLFFMMAAQLLLLAPWQLPTSSQISARVPPQNRSPRWCLQRHRGRCSAAKDGGPGRSTVQSCRPCSAMHPEPPSCRRACRPSRPHVTLQGLLQCSCLLNSTYEATLW